MRARSKGKLDEDDDAQESQGKDSQAGEPTPAKKLRRSGASESLLGEDGSGSPPSTSKPKSKVLKF